MCPTLFSSGRLHSVVYIHHRLHNVFPFFVYLRFTLLHMIAIYRHSSSWLFTTVCLHVSFIARACDNFGFTISTKKTYVMHQSAQQNMYHEPHIFVNDEPLKLPIISPTWEAPSPERPILTWTSITDFPKPTLHLEECTWLWCQPSCSMHVSHGLCIAETPANSTTSIQNVCELF